MKPEISDLQRQVQKNCDISDARHAGAYSRCSFLLRMRDLYKWEHQMLPWQEPEPADLMEWVEVREQYRAEIVEGEIASVCVDTPCGRNGERTGRRHRGRRDQPQTVPLFMLLPTSCG